MQLRNKMGYIATKAVTFWLCKMLITCRYVVRKMRTLEEMDEQWALAQAQNLFHTKDRKADGWTLFQKVATNFSGGAKQSFYANRTGDYSHPEIFIFDDSFSCVRLSKTDGKFTSGLKKKQQKSTVLMWHNVLEQFMHADALLF